MSFAQNPPYSVMISISHSTQKGQPAILCNTLLMFTFWNPIIHSQEEIYPGGGLTDSTHKRANPKQADQLQACEWDQETLQEFHLSCIFILWMDMQGTFKPMFILIGIPSWPQDSRSN